MYSFNFDYLIDKISIAKFSYVPFKHIYIEDFFDDEHFNTIIKCPEISLEEATSDKNLFKILFKNNYKVISFPGCTTNYKEYINKHTKKEFLKATNTACEGAGVVLRLYPKTEVLVALNNFLTSKKFNTVIAKKFNINISNCDIDGGIQKYLDGYEISPHPDIRRKAATYMININPHKASETFNYHTHYLRLKKNFNYVKKFWETSSKVERSWVPWDWCDSKFIQSKNNSIVLFSPSNDTMHGVKAVYDHLSTQRTQLYGNLWYLENNKLLGPSWEQLAMKDFSIPNNSITKNYNLLNNFVKLSKKIIKKFFFKDPNIGDRGY
jgi:hypothetical protein